MVRWTGFADLSFGESAHMALARAIEHAQTEAHAELPDAWLVEDRRLSFSVTTETSRPVLEGIRRVLAALVLDAVAGDVSLEVEHPYERWIRKAALPSISKEITVGEDALEGAGETIRTAAS
jgi:hypothetical protein